MKMKENRVLAGIVLAACVVVSVFGLGGWKLQGEFEDVEKVFLNGVDPKQERHSMESYLDRCAEYAETLSYEADQYLPDGESTERVRTCAKALSKEDGLTDGRAAAYEDLSDAVEKLYSDLQKAEKDGETAIARAYGDYQGAEDLIRRDGYADRAKDYNKLAGKFPAKLIAALWGVSEAESFGNGRR